jgi:hypothetical protein
VQNLGRLSSEEQGDKSMGGEGSEAEGMKHTLAVLINMADVKPTLTTGTTHKRHTYIHRGRQGG